MKESNLKSQNIGISEAYISRNDDGERLEKIIVEMPMVGIISHTIWLEVELIAGAKKVLTV